jgi:hypothetical protein
MNVVTVQYTGFGMSISWSDVVPGLMAREPENRIVWSFFRLLNNVLLLQIGIYMYYALA